MILGCSLAKNSRTSTHGISCAGKTIMLKKQALLTLLLILAFGAIAFGQAGRFEVGLAGGPSFILLRGNNIINNIHEPAVGFAAGGSLQWNLSRILSLKVNPAFERKGSMAFIPITDANGENVGTGRNYLNYDYLTLPIMAAATFGRDFRYFVNGGPYVGYLIRQFSTFRAENLPRGNFNGTSQQKRLDFGISMGMGMSVPLSPSFNFSLEVRENLGLTNVSALPVINNNGRPGSILTNSVALQFGLTYGWGRRGV